MPNKEEGRGGRMTIIVVAVMAIILGCYCTDSVEAEINSGSCTSESLPPDVLELMSRVNITLIGLKSLLWAPSSTPSGEMMDDSVLEAESITQGNLMIFLLRKLENENKQLRQKMSAMESEQTRIKEQSSEIKKQLHNSQLETQKSDTRCHSSADWPKDCYDLLNQGKNESGIYTIYPQKCGFVSKGVRVWCDMEGPDAGWTVVLLRRPLEGEQINFNLGWRYYRLGFGDPETEYWIGNDVLHKMTSGRSQMLRVDMTDWDGQSKYAEYGTFQVENADGEFRLHISGYSGNAGDSMAHHNNRLFSTPDRDNDASTGTHCGQDRKAGFWYGGCEHVGATHPLLSKQKNHLGVHWYTIGNDHTTLKSMTFKLRPSICLRD